MNLSEEIQVQINKVKDLVYKNTTNHTSLSDSIPKLKRRKILNNTQKEPEAETQTKLSNTHASLKSLKVPIERQSL